MAGDGHGTLQFRVESSGPEFGVPGAELTIRPKLAFLLPMFCDA
jgi:hypothetical protein